MASAHSTKRLSGSCLAQQVSRTAFKVGLGPAQGQSAAFRFHEVHGLLVGQGAASIALVRLGQRGRKHELHHFATHDCCCVHGGGKLLRLVLAFKPTFQGKNHTKASCKEASSLRDTSILRAALGEASVPS